MSSESKIIALKMEVLVIEDNILHLKLITEILENEGYKVRPASDGELALKSIEASPPEIILMDFNLPGLDGVEVCRKLKSNLNTKSVPIIFISAMDQTDLKVKALESGASDYITKPIVAEEVIARISTHLNISKLQKKLVLQTEELLIENEKRKKIEEELRTYKENLEELVKERTKELSKINVELNNSLNLFVQRETTINNLRKRIEELESKNLTKNKEIQSTLNF